MRLYDSFYFAIHTHNHILMLYIRNIIDRANVYINMTFLILPNTQSFISCLLVFLNHFITRIPFVRMFYGGAFIAVALIYCIFCTSYFVLLYAYRLLFKYSDTSYSSKYTSYSQVS